MTNQQIADRLVELCRKGQFDTCYEELYASNAESFEMEGVPHHHVKGLDQLKAKSAAWAADVEQLHEFRVSEPVVGGGYFSVSMYLDLEKKDGSREKAEEICLYKTKDGKIVEERFFYEM